ncbi:MAG: O-antigen ligase family protein [Phormidesmis sp. RL_2_1]|nr:O-antigen ligase family protein [Phormidesmis sp. RL_2_1]
MGLVAIALYAARRHYWVMMAGLAGSGAIAAAVLSLGIGGRSLSVALITQDPRVGVWRLALAMIRQRPLLGWGFSGLRELYIPGSIPGHEAIFHAHNIWLFLASEAGIPVMLGFCLIVGKLYYDGIKAFLKGGLSAENRGILLGYLLAFTSCLLFGLFDVVLFDARLNVLTWGLLSSIYVLSHAAVLSYSTAVSKY